MEKVVDRKTLYQYFRRWVYSSYDSKFQNYQIAISKHDQDRIAYEKVLEQNEPASQNSIFRFCDVVSRKHMINLQNVFVRIQNFGSYKKNLLEYVLVNYRSKGDQYWIVSEAFKILRLHNLNNQFIDKGLEIDELKEQNITAEQKLRQVNGEFTKNMKSLTQRVCIKILSCSKKNFLGPAFQKLSQNCIHQQSIGIKKRMVLKMLAMRLEKSLKRVF